MILNQESAQPLWGKYRGEVIDNLDPLVLGRLEVIVPGLPNLTPSTWAMPCVPYAGFQVGFFFMPPIGANVWVEFEGGDPSRPVWVGCFWDEGQVPFENPDPQIKVLRTKFNTLIFNDTPEVGGFTINTIDPAVDVPVTIVGSSEGLEISAPPANFTMNPEIGISAEYPPGTIDLTEAVLELQIGATSVSITEAAIEVECPETNIIGNVSVEGAVEIEGDLEVTGAVEIEGDLEVTGAAEIEGVLEVTGDVTILGDMDMLGAFALLGDFSFLGAIDGLGDIALLGAIEVAGDVAVGGPSEAAIFIPPVLF